MGEEGLDVASLDIARHHVQVVLASDRTFQSMGHWVAIFCFGDADLCICEESSVDSEGIRFGGIDWVFRLRRMTVEDFLEKDGGALQCRHRVEHDDLFVPTSPAELWHRCRTHP